MPDKFERHYVGNIDDAIAEAMRRRTKQSESAGGSDDGEPVKNRKLGDESKDEP